MLVLQGEWEYDRYMSKMLRKLKQPHATRASHYIRHPEAHTDHEGVGSLHKGFGLRGQRESQELRDCWLPSLLPFRKPALSQRALPLVHILDWFPTTC